MLTFKFTQVNGTMSEADTLTSGMVGKQCKLEFSSEWDGMQKTAVFTAGTTVRDVVNVEEIVEIPAECLVRPNTRLYVGVYGVADGGRVIPTIIVPGPYIIPGADPSGDESTNPELPVWAQLQEQINDLQAGGGGAAIQPDWNQNDEMAPDYVHGRTHYVEKKIVEETRVLRSDSNQPMDSFWETVYENRQTARYCLKDTVFHFVKDYEPGVDVPFSLLAWEVASETRVCSVVINTGVDTGVDTIGLVPGALNGPPPTDVIGGLDITVPIETEVVHRLDEKFIPEKGELIINLTNQGDWYSYDCTFADIRSAYQRGYSVHAIYSTRPVMSLIQCTSDNALFVTIGGDGKLYGCRMSNSSDACTAFVYTL